MANPSDSPEPEVAIQPDGAKKRFWQRIAENKVAQWLMGYAGVALAVLHAEDMVAKAFGWPEIVSQVLILAVCIGAAVVVVLAWFHGEKGLKRASNFEITILAVALLAGGLLLTVLLRAPARHAERAEVAKALTPGVHPEAEAAYRRGLALMAKRNTADLQNAIDAFREAINLDDQYADAHAALGRTYTLLLSNGQSTDARELALRQIEAALKIDPNNLTAQLTLAVYKENAWNFAESAEILLSTIEHHPENADAYHHYAELLAILNMPERATELARRAVEKAPNEPIMLSSIGSYLRQQKKYEDSVGEYRSALLLDQQFRFALYGLCWSYVDMDQVDNAEEVLNAKLAAIDGKDGPNTDLCRAAIARRQGDRTELARLSAIARQRFERGEHTAADVAFYYVLSGEKAESLAWFEKAYDAQSVHQLLLFLWEPATQELFRDDPNWSAFMKRPLMRKWQSEREKIAARSSAKNEPISR